MGIGIVETKHGKVRGTEYDGKYKGITIFKGIPYAKPPVGELRWKPPAEADAWDGVLECNDFRDAPAQDFMALPYEPIRRELYCDGYPNVSEDCLYIHICTGAQKAGEKRPVYMWFHGGGVRLCHASEIEFNPQELARKNVVVVLVSQRLNVFGYLAIPQLSAEQGGKSGNYGLMDQVKALDWVYENIEQFGGDPENITVGGQSGGTHKTCALSVSKAAKGRVRRVINQTGNMWMRVYPDIVTAEKRGIAYLKHAGVDPELSIDALRALPWQEVYCKRTPMFIMPGEMVYDGYLVPCKTLRESFDLYANNIDFLNSCTLGEANVFGDSLAGFNDFPVHDYINRIETSADFYAHYQNLLGPLYKKYDFEELIKVTDENAWYIARRLTSYGLTGSQVVVLPGSGGNYNKNLMLNRIFGMHMKRIHPQNKCYSLLFSHLMPTREEDRGTGFDSNKVLAWHASDLWFSFSSIRPGVPPTRDWREIDYKVADMTSSYWANFIKTGDPNENGLPYWPQSGDEYGYLEIDDAAQGHKGMNKLDQLIHEFTCAEYKVDG